eukprot:GHVT01033131.1.p1 GENE.GHVT01033131.1~~GHVT01033131.1.p1  ORF type:complete len:328 (+),score=33.56 GHVT01033131.1:154-1137(+)
MMEAPQAPEKDRTPYSGKVDLGDCRFYEKEFPDVEELVMVKVNRIADLGAYVSLLEYNNMEGMILMSELSKRRFRSVNKLIRVGRHEVVLVIRVDPAKGYIDLSKKRVSPEDIIKCEERYSKAKKVHQCVRHVAQKNGIKVHELNAKVIWPLYRKYGHALDALKLAATNPADVFDGLEVDQKVKGSLIDDIKIRLTPVALKIRGRIDVWCFGRDGIDAVREALEKGREIGFAKMQEGTDAARDKEVEFQIKLIAPPQYVAVTSCLAKERGVQAVEAAIQAIRDSIRSFKGGDFKQQGEIAVMGGEEEKRLEELFEGVCLCDKGLCDS